MDNIIPNNILANAKERGFVSVKFDGEYDGISYYYYVRNSKFTIADYLQL